MSETLKSERGANAGSLARLARPRGLYNRVLKAYEEGRPLHLRSGDVMMLRHYFADEGLMSQESFETQASWGGGKLRQESGPSAELRNPQP